MGHDCAVIGAGVSGLSAAILMASHGRSVALIEQGRQPAPLVRGFRRGGIRFDTGFHYAGGLERGEVLNTYLRYLGVAQAIETRPLNQDGFDVIHVRQAGRTFAFPYSLPRLLERFRSAFPDQASGIESFLDRVQEGFSRSPLVNFGSSTILPSAEMWADDQPLDTVLRSEVSDPLCRTFFTAHSLLYGVAPEDFSFQLYAKVMGPYFQSVSGIKGGGTALAEALVARARDLGVDFVLGRAATRIHAGADAGVGGVELDDGQVVACKACVCTIYPGLVPGLMPEGALRPVYCRRIEALRESASAYILFLSADTVPEGVLGANHYLLHDIGTAGFFDPAAPLDHRPVYVAASDAGSGRAAVIIFTPGYMEDVAPWADSLPGKRPPGYAAHKQEVARQVLERVTSELPWLQGASLQEVATPMTMRRYTRAPRGGLYGALQEYGSLGLNPRTRMPGFYLAGQSVVGPGILGAIISAVLATGEMLGLQHLLEGLRRCHADAS